MRLIYFSPVHWTSYRQRPHYLVEFLLQADLEAVLWVNPYPQRLPRPSDLWHRRSSLFQQHTFNHPNITVYSMRALPVESLPGGDAINRHLVWPSLLVQLKEFHRVGRTIFGIGRPSALALQALEAFPDAWAFYDAMDDYPCFFSGRASATLSSLENRLVKRVDLLIVSSHGLLDKFRNHGSLPWFLPNATCAAGFPDPSLEKPIPPIFGYVGAIADWFDWELLERLATTYREAQFQLIGPVFRPFRRKLPPNVVFLGAIDHSQAIHLMKDFSVGLIPFRCNRLTASVDPIKYYDYRCLGLPVLSTPFGEMRRRAREEGVFLLDRDEILEEIVERALTYRSNLPIIRAFRQSHDWQQRFIERGLDRMVDLIHNSRRSAADTRIGAHRAKV